jgi:tetratricopeptide (TPR) repeat protein
VPDWRWLLDRSDSPWYDSATLFRQPAPGDWDSVLASVRQALERRFTLCGDPPADTSLTPMDPLAAKSTGSLASAFAHYHAGDTSTAAVMCREILAADAQCFDALHLLGTIDAAEGRFDAALDWFDRALLIDPRHPDAQRNRQSATHQFVSERVQSGLAAHRQGDLAEAERSYESVLKRDPDNFDALQLLGTIAVQRGQLSRGLALLDRAIALKPDSFDAHTNRGIALTELKRFDEAIASHSHALATRPESGDARFNRAMLHLLLGDYITGLPEYEWRRKRESRNKKARVFDQPSWLGDRDLNGMRILLHAEQGFGDSIQFCRFVPLVAAMGAYVILEAPNALASLMTSLNGVAQTIGRGEVLPFDFHCPLPSLPLAFKTNLDTLSGQPYLTAPSERVADWSKVLGKATRPRVGLAWSGSKTHKSDRKRSIPLTRFSRALPGGIEYIQLQKDVRTDDQAWLAQHPEIRSFEAQINDFGDTAALIESLDLVITVDTSVAHLAGALGKDIWILLPHVPDWRWLLDRTDSPWYDSATLFRQPAPGDWDSVLASVRQALELRFSSCDAPPSDAPPAPIDYPAALRIDSLASAFVHYHAGDTASAAVVCREILVADPHCFDALHLLGVINAAEGRFDAALDWFDRALLIDPRHPDAQRNRRSATHQFASERVQSGLAAHRQGDLSEAEGSYEAVLKRDPDNFDALQLLGAIAAATGRPELALAFFDRALAIKADCAKVFYNRGSVFRDLNRPEDALLSYERAIAIEPDYAEAHNNRGLVLMELNRLDDALTSFNDAIALVPDYARAHDHRGLVLSKLGRFVEALSCHTHAASLTPNHATTHLNRGNVLLAMKRFDEALASYDRAIELRPDFAEAHNNRGYPLKELNRIEDALTSYNYAITIKPDYAEAHSNLGLVLMELGRFDEALASYERSLALTPDYPEANLNDGLLRLLLGDFVRGWQEYEWRWQRTGRTESPRAYHQPLWLGEADLHGKCILLWSEQGFGDSIQFSRYASKVAALGAEAILEGPAVLKPLLEPLSGVSKFVTQGSPLPAFDFHCPLPSLPLAFKTNLDTLVGQPYLTAPSERIADWSKVLGKATRPRVGLAWSGSKTNKPEDKRSILLTRFIEGLPQEIEYVQLQKGVSADDQVWLAQHPEIRSFDAQIRDFGDTAALIDALDLVITIDTSIAHLAGALGKEVWILLAHVPDWRWLLDRTDSPWYDSATLFRQPAPGDWDSVLVAVRQALAQRFGKLPFRASRHH